MTVIRKTLTFLENNTGQQGVNQKVTIGTVNPQLRKQTLACPNVAGGGVFGGGEGTL